MNQEALENLVRIHKLHHEAADSNEVQGLISNQPDEIFWCSRCTTLTGELREYRLA